MVIDAGSLAARKSLTLIIFIISHRTRSIFGVEGKPQIGISPLNRVNGGHRADDADSLDLDPRQESLVLLRDRITELRFNDEPDPGFRGRRRLHGCGDATFCDILVSFAMIDSAPFG
jgi:hypothetical protein